MNGQDRLERGYRRLLAWYPRSFRRDSEDEIVVVQLAAAVTIVVTAATVRAAIASQPGLAAVQRSQELSLLTFREIGAVAAVGVWLLTAWAISQGRDVARFSFLSFFALITLMMLVALAQHGAADAAADMIAGAAVWLIALATMVLIFTRQSNRYYRQAVQPAVHS
jgi:putative copper export protein